MKLHLPFKWQNAEPSSERTTISLITEYIVSCLILTKKCKGLTCFIPMKSGREGQG